MRPITNVLLIVCGGLVIANSLSASVPRSISYQGQLLNASNQPVPNGSYSMNFKIYSDTAGGTVVWQENRTVPVTGGLYSLTLGEVNPIPDSALSVVNVAFRPSLEVQVNGETLSPRVRLNTTPSSFSSNRIVGDFQTAPGRLSLGMLPGGGTSDRFKIDLQADNSKAGLTIEDSSGAGIFFNISDAVFARGLTSPQVAAKPSMTFIDTTGDTLARITGGDLVASGTIQSGHSIIINGNSGLITSTTGQISFDNENLVTSGKVTTNQFQMPTGASNGYVLTSDAVGIGGWQPIGAIGGCWVCPGGNLTYLAEITDLVGIGTNTPTSKLHVVGDARITTKANIGNNNTNAGTYAFVVGENGIASGNWSAVTGGSGNQATANYSTVSGGQQNSAGFTVATVGGGYSNDASGHGATIAGGDNNTAGGSRSTVAGGQSNQSTASYASVGGGNTCIATAQDATVGGGAFNSAVGWGTTIGGGDENRASGIQATIAGGVRDTAIGDQSSIGGGTSNITRGKAATIAGGWENVADSDYTFVGGGKYNWAVNAYATVAGGDSNTAQGFYSMVPGGYFNQASGDYSFAAGRNASAAHNGAFVWSDASGSGFTSTSDNQFLINAAGGVGIATNAPNSRLHVSGAIATAFTSTGVNITLGAANSVVKCQNPFAPINVTLPTAVGIPGRQYTIKRTSTQNATVLTTGGQTIDGAASYLLSAQWKYVTVVSDGANWLIVANN